MSLIEAAAFTVNAYIGYKVLGAIDVGKILPLTVINAKKQDFLQP